MALSINPRIVLLLVAAFAAAVGTGLYAKNWIIAERAAWLANQPKEAPKAAAVLVLVAKKNMPVGQFVKPTDLEWTAWPEEGVTDDYIVKTEKTAKKDMFEGSVVRSAITSGEPINALRLVNPGERGFLAAVLKPGNRAVSVPVNATTGISGFVFPGDWVDVLMTAELKGNQVGAEVDFKKIEFSETLLSEVRVLAIDQQVENAGAARVGKTATLEVTPKQAEILALGRRVGGLSLSLRSLASVEIDQSDRFSQVARSIGSDPTLPNPNGEVENSYTLEFELMNFLKDPRLLKQVSPKKKKRAVTVFRADKAEQKAF